MLEVNKVKLSMKYKTLKIGLLLVGFLLTSSCSVGVPSPLNTGSWYYGEVDGDHIGLEVVFPWADREKDTPEGEPKVNKP